MVGSFGSGTEADEEMGDGVAGPGMVGSAGDFGIAGPRCGVPGSGAGGRDGGMAGAEPVIVGLGTVYESVSGPLEAKTGLGGPADAGAAGRTAEGGGAAGGGAIGEWIGAAIPGDDGSRRGSGGGLGSVGETGSGGGIAAFCGSAGGPGGLLDSRSPGRRSGLAIVGWVLSSDSPSGVLSFRKDTGAQCTTAARGYGRTQTIWASTAPCSTGPKPLLWPIALQKR